jgi:hypothetical protein
MARGPDQEARAGALFRLGLGGGGGWRPHRADRLGAHGYLYRQLKGLADFRVYRLTTGSFPMTQTVDFATAIVQDHDLSDETLDRHNETRICSGFSVCSIDPD